jgi:hypothetical protein
MVVFLAFELFPFIPQIHFNFHQFNLLLPPLQNGSFHPTIILVIPLLINNQIINFPYQIFFLLNFFGLNL